MGAMEGIRDKRCWMVLKMSLGMKELMSWVEIEGMEDTGVFSKVWLDLVGNTTLFQQYSAVK